MAREITTPVVLENSNLVPGSEVVRIKGAPIPALIRDADYIIDYKKGEIRFLATGAAVSFSSLIEQNGVDVAYSYEIDFTDPELFESQVEVFDEVAQRVDELRIAVENGPVVVVTRILNQTTQEEYETQSVNGNQIVFSATVPPRTEDLELVDTVLENIQLDIETLRHLNTFSITYPSRFDAARNPVTSLDQLQSLTTDQYLLVIGGEETLNTTIVINVPLEANDIQLITGGRTFRRSNVLLSPETDFTFSFITKLADTDFQELTIELAPTAIQKIRTNNLYMNLGFLETFELQQQNVFETKTHHVNERLTFTTDEETLPLLPRLTALGDIGDQLIEPLIQVISTATGFIYEEGIDYTLNIVQRKITRLSSGRITAGEQVLIYYIEDRTVRANFELVADVVLVDYVWSNNSLNWSNLRKEVPITQVEELIQNTQFVTLTNTPLDFNEVLIYLQGDTFRRPVAAPISFNALTLRLHIEPIPTDGTYVLEYTAISQPIREGSPYFVSYKYGATRDVLRDKFARLVGINNTQTQREEIIALPGGATQAQLSRSPTTVSDVLIFAENDPREEPVATPLSFDGVTSTLTFTSISRAGRYVFRYLTDGFDTASLRTATEKLFETFPEGPTLSAFENIISGFVETPPVITTGLTNRFVLPNQEHTTGNQIALRPFEPSPPLEDGSDSVIFFPARFNLGAVIESSKEGFVRAPAPSNIGILEGTLEFLVGILFEVNDERLHYFVDVLGEDPRRNRFSVYKNTDGKLNFDIWDNKGQLFRASADVNQVYNTEIIELTAGDSTATLSFDATPAQLDLDDNLTPDLYDGLETTFIIMPETPTFPEDFRRASIKVLGYDAPTREVTFEPVDFSGRYIFSYVSGLVKFEETENFIAITWKLHTHDGEAPYYRLYINGRRIINQTLQDIDFEAGTPDQSTYDNSQYDIDVYEDTP